MTNNSNYAFKTRVAAVITIAAGYGWAGGHYIPDGSPLVAYLFQLAMIILLLIFSIAFVGLNNNATNTITRGRWPVTALGIFAGVTLLINIANIIHGAMDSNPHSFGSHNTFADLVPVSIIMAGDIMWLATMLAAFRIKTNQL
jgi:hypothetical protein